MASRRSNAESTLKTFLGRLKRKNDVDNDTALFAEGIGLDSLETAELSAILEDELGSDPFSEGDMPATVGDLLSFYDEKEGPATGA